MQHISDELEKWTKVTETFNMEKQFSVEVLILKAWKLSLFGI